MQAPQTDPTPLLSAFSNTMSPTPFTMPLPNNRPIFKGLEKDWAIQFLDDFETRASALVGAHDSVRPREVQQYSPMES